MKTNNRRRIYVQESIQGGLAIRCVVYWCSCLVSVFLFLMIASILTQPSSIGEVFGGVWMSYSAAIFASLLMLPLVIMDMVRFSHRVVGPLIRLEREMQRLAEGKSVRPLQFREGDFWDGLAEQFNTLRMRHLQLGHQAYVNTRCDRKEVKEPVVLRRYPV